MKDLPVAVIVIPTYNEIENISLLIDEIFSYTNNWHIKILVVDSNSPDGTATVVEEKTKKLLDLYLYKEPKKEGLGSAYVKGLSFAIKNLDADVVIEFDSDFQHPPEYIPLLLKEIDNGYDYVLGSRKIEGGCETYHRSIFRSLLTSIGSFVARFILFFPTKNFWLVTDATTGLKATRVKGYIDSLNLNPDHLHSKKFGYKVQLLSETLALGARYKEIPLKFDDRRAGLSKFESSTIKEVLLACIKTRLKSKYTKSP